jgi:hypothetical protein
MLCKIAACEKEARYKKAELCQMHYFRKMRNGTFDNKPKAERYISPNGYYSIRRVGHPLADSVGMVREHRYVYFENNNKNPGSCEMCKAKIDWKTLHIDHIDSNRKNNSPENLRALCRACNVNRERPMTAGCKHVFTIEGLSMSAHAWARRGDVKLSGRQIIRRKKDFGWSDFDCVYKERTTHKTTKTKSGAGTYDSMRLEAQL